MAKKDTQSTRRPTRRQVALSKREQEKVRLIYMGLALVGALVVIALAFGLLQTYVFEPNSPVATVNGEKITLTEYQERVRYDRFILEDLYQQRLSEYQAIPTPEEGDQLGQLIRDQYEQRVIQVLQQRSVVDRQTLDIMIEDKLIEAEAQKRAITVAADEITEAINRFLANEEGGVTADAALEISTAVAEATATAAVWTPTPTFTPSPTLTTTEEITQPTPTPVNTPTPAPTPTLNVIGEETLATQYSNWMNTLAEAIDVDEAKYRQFIHSLILRNKLYEAIANEVPTSAEQVHARRILVETEEEADQVIERLEAGEDFADLAQELSLDQNSACRGGDLDFVPRGYNEPSVEEALFTLPIGQVSEPIETEQGWYVLEVLEREDRELSPELYNQSQRLAFNDWLTDAQAAAQIENLWDPEKAPPDPFL